MTDRPNSSSPLPALKIRSRLRSLRGDRLDQLALIVMSGSFSPVHMQHIRAMEVVRLALERAGWTVVGGFLAPSSDSYLEEKLDRETSSFDRRIEWCRLATQESEWLAVCTLGEFSSYRACTRIRDQVERQCSEWLEGHSLAGLEVMGSDTTIRIIDKLIDEWASTNAGKRESWYSGRIVCCVIRPGSTSRTDMEHILTFTAPRATEMGITVMLIDADREGLPLEAVSSTEIRELLQKNDWHGLRARSWLDPEVLRSLETTNGI